MTANLLSFEASRAMLASVFFNCCSEVLSCFFLSFQKFRHLFSGILLESGPFKTGFGESVNTRDQKRPALETLHATFLTLHDENKKKRNLQQITEGCFLYLMTSPQAPPLIFFLFRNLFLRACVTHLKTLRIIST
jgi:hypothetical protein